MNVLAEEDDEERNKFVLRQSEILRIDFSKSPQPITKKQMDDCRYLKATKMTISHMDFITRILPSFIQLMAIHVGMSDEVPADPNIVTPYIEALMTAIADHPTCHTYQLDKIWANEMFVLELVRDTTKTHVLKYGETIDVSHPSLPENANLEILDEIDALEKRWETFLIRVECKAASELQTTDDGDVYEPYPEYLFTYTVPNKEVGVILLVLAAVKEDQFGKLRSPQIHKLATMLCNHLRNPEDAKRALQQLTDGDTGH